MRFFCWGEVVEKTAGGGDEGRFEGLVKRTRGEKVEGIRAVILLRVWKVCGFDFLYGWAPFFCNIRLGIKNSTTYRSNHPAATASPS